MDTKVKDAPEVKAAGTESHYHSKKDRVFVRGIQGQYSLKDELKRLRSMPRVRKGKELKFVDGPQTYSRHYVEPKDGITQMFHLHLEEYAPGGKSQKHGHVNEAAFYILEGVEEGPQQPEALSGEARGRGGRACAQRQAPEARPSGGHALGALAAGAAQAPAERG